MPCDYKIYPKDWREIRERKLREAGHCCQGSPRFPHCRASNYEPHPQTGSKVVLSLCHFDRDITNNDDDNLKVWCQRCHINHDISQHIYSRKYGDYYSALQLKIKFMHKDK